MLSARVLVLVVALSVAALAGYVEVYVEEGPEVEGLHIYAWDGESWAPVYVTYVPEYIDTYIASAGRWASMPYYNMSRYILHIPREAFRRGPPSTPPGLERWILEVQNGTKKAVVELAVGRKPITKGNATLATWSTLGTEPPRTPNRGKFTTPRGQPKRDKATGEVGITSYAVSKGTTIYPIGSLYFKQITVSGSFATYLPVDTPTGINTLCGLSQMHWVGFEVQNLTVGVKVSGTLYYGSVALEFYNLDTCTYITTMYLTPPSSGVYWTNLYVTLPQDSQIGVRIRASGYAPYSTTINVYIAARYRKTVNDLAQIATTKATTYLTPRVSSSYRYKVAVLFGPYVAYDGLAATTAGTTFNYIYVPPSSVRLYWTGQYCSSIFVEYYVNGVLYLQRFVGPTTSSPAGGYYCNYEVPSTVLQLRARDYAISKALSSGGGITVSVVYQVWNSPDATISYSGNLEIAYSRWIEPFHSNYIDNKTGEPYLNWGVMLLLNTYQILGSIKATNLNMITEVRSS
ncbi:MAG: hypothetical protein ACPL3C_09805, partial [Pyrobaculum sp.]